MADDKGRNGGIPRREALKVLGSIPAALTASQIEARTADHSHVPAAPIPAGVKAADKPKFFTEHEWKTGNLLADTIIPRGGRSWSASEAGAAKGIAEAADLPGGSRAPRI